MKRIIALIMSLLILVLAITSCSNNNPNTETEPIMTDDPVAETIRSVTFTGNQVKSDDGLTGKIIKNEDGSRECALLYYFVTTTDVIIPDNFNSLAYKNVPITYLGDGRSCVITNRNNEAITSITLPSQTIMIRANAFSLYTKLENLKLNEGLKVVDNMAFYLCKNLSSLTLPSTLISIGENAFQGCAIKTLTIPSSVTYIGNSAFGGCKNLKSVTIPKVFENNLESIFGENVKNITFTFT